MVIRGLGMKMVMEMSERHGLKTTVFKQGIHGE